MQDSASNLSSPEGRGHLPQGSSWEVLGKVLTKQTSVQRASLSQALWWEWTCWPHTHVVNPTCSAWNGFSSRERDSVPRRLGKGYILVGKATTKSRWYYISLCFESFVELLCSLHLWSLLYVLIAILKSWVAKLWLCPLCQSESTCRWWKTFWIAYAERGAQNRVVENLVLTNRTGGAGSRLQVQKGHPQPHTELAWQATCAQSNSHCPTC